MTEQALTPAQFRDMMAALGKQDQYMAMKGEWDFQDPKAGHERADELMLEVLESLGYGAGCDIFRSADKWYA